MIMLITCWGRPSRALALCDFVQQDLRTGAVGNSGSIDPKASPLAAPSEHLVGRVEDDARARPPEEAAESPGPVDLRHAVEHVRIDGGGVRRGCSGSCSHVPKKHD